MAGILSYTIEADWNLNQLYNHSYSDLTAYVIRATWNNGFNQPYQEVAPPSRLTLLLDNSTGFFSVRNTNSPLYGVYRPGALVRVGYTLQTLDGGATADLTYWIGKTTRLQVAPGQYAKTATLTCEDPMLDLLSATYFPPLMTDVTTDEVLERMFDDGVILHPYARDYWIMGVSTLGDNTTLWENTFTNFETGDTTLAYAGDNADRGSGVSAQGYIRQVVAAECGGKFFWSARTGKFVFWNRRYITSLSPPTIYSQIAGFTEDGAEYVYGDNVFNSVDVSYEPREVGSAGSIIYTAQAPISVQAGGERSFTARFREPNSPDAHCGAEVTITPVPGTDFTANTAEDGSGSSVLANIGVSFLANAQSATVTLYNNSNATAYVRDFQIRGTPLLSYGRTSVSSLVPWSIFGYGIRKKTVDAGMLSDPDVARGYAHALASRFALPTDELRHISFILQAFQGSSTAVADGKTQLQIGSVFSIYDSTLNDTPPLDDGQLAFVIVGEQHQIEVSQQFGKLAEHHVTWTLESYDRTTYWILGDPVQSRLGVTTRLTF